MVTVDNNEQLDRENILDRRWFPIVTFSIGVFVSLIDTIYLLARGSNLENAVWPLAIRTLGDYSVFAQECPAGGVAVRANPQFGTLADDA